MRVHKLGEYIFFGLIILIIAGLVYSSITFKSTINPQAIKNRIVDYGTLTPLAFILIIIILCIISIFPTGPFLMAAGYLFGTFLGTIYGLIGLLIGTSLVFCLSRYFGRPFVRRFVDDKELEHFDYFFKKRGLFALFIIRLVPAFPADIISFGAGLTKIRYRTFMGISFLIMVPAVTIANAAGDLLSDIRQLKSLLLLICIIVLAMFFIIYVFRQKIKKMLIKEERSLGRDVRRVEKDIKDEGKILLSDIIKSKKSDKKERFKK